MNRYAQCAAITLNVEGRWSDDPHDPGGPTMKGVTIRVFAGFLGVPLTKDNWDEVKARLRRITDADMHAIYKRNYWDPIRADELPAGVDLAAFDFAINSGVAQASKCVQRAAGSTRADGHIGMSTLAAVRARNPQVVIRDMMTERRNFLRGLPTFWRFGKGWMVRCDEVERRALADAAQVPTALPVMEADPDPDTVSVEQGRAYPQDPMPPWQTEVTLTGGGSTGIATEVSTAISRMQEFSVRGFAIALLSSPTFWISTIALVSGLYVFLWRRKWSTR